MNPTKKVQDAVRRARAFMQSSKTWPDEIAEELRREGEDVALFWLSLGVKAPEARSPDDVCPSLDD